MINLTYSRAFLAFASAILLAFSGYMVTPGNGATMGSKTSYVTIGGWVETAHERITVSAMNPKTKLWEVIATATSDDTNMEPAQRLPFTHHRDF